MSNIHAPLPRNPPHIPPIPRSLNAHIKHLHPQPLSPPPFFLPHLLPTPLSLISVLPPCLPLSRLPPPRPLSPLSSLPIPFTYLNAFTFFRPSSSLSSFPLSLPHPSSIRPRHRARPFPMPVVTSNDRGLAALATLHLSPLSSPPHLSHRYNPPPLPFVQTSYPTIPSTPHNNLGTNMLCQLSAHHAPPVRYQTRPLPPLHRHNPRSIALLRVHRMRPLSRLFLHPVHGRLCRLWYHSPPRRLSRPRYQITSFTTGPCQAYASSTSQKNLVVTKYPCTPHFRSAPSANPQTWSEKSCQISSAADFGGGYLATSGAAHPRPTPWRRHACRPRARANYNYYREHINNSDPTNNNDNIVVYHNTGRPTNVHRSFRGTSWGRGRPQGLILDT